MRINSGYLYFIEQFSKFGSGKILVATQNTLCNKIEPINKFYK